MISIPLNLKNEIENVIKMKFFVTVQTRRINLLVFLL